MTSRAYTSAYTPNAKGPTITDRALFLPMVALQGFEPRTCGL